MTKYAKVNDPVINEMMRDALNELIEKFPGMSVTLIMAQPSDKPGAPLFYASNSDTGDMFNVLAEMTARLAERTSKGSA